MVDDNIRSPNDINTQGIQMHTNGIQTQTSGQPCDIQKFIEMMQLIKNSFPCIGEQRPRYSDEEDDKFDIIKSKISPRFKPSQPRQFQNQNRPRRLDELDPEEREERINRGFARLMQMMTFFGHVDNFLTDKASSLVKLMGRAMETENDQDPNIVSNANAYRITRTCPSQTVC